MLGVKSYSASGNHAPPSSFTETHDGRDKREDKGMKEILRLGDYGQKIMDITKKYLNTIWKKRKMVFCVS